MENDESELSKYFLIKHIITNMSCAICQNRYEEDDIHFIDHHDDIWIMSIVCKQCHTRGQVFALIKEHDDETTMAELTLDEWAKFQEMPQIDSNEVLDMHQLLKNFEGDFGELFES